MSTFHCSRCSQDLPETDFYTSSRGRYGYCKPCARAYQLTKRTGSGVRKPKGFNSLTDEAKDDIIQKMKDHREYKKTGGESGVKNTNRSIARDLGVSAATITHWVKTGQIVIVDEEEEDREVSDSETIIDQSS